MKRSPAGFLVSVAVHTLFIAALLWPRHRPAVAIEEPGSPPGPAHVRIFGTPKPRTAPSAAPDRPARPHARRPPPRVNPVAAAAVEEPPSKPDPAEEPVLESTENDSPDAREIGDEMPAGGGGDGPGGFGGGAIAGMGNGPAGPVAFDETMTPPRRISGPDPKYTLQALEHEVEGTMLVRCVVGLDGGVRECRIVRGVPFMDREVVETLERRRYSPALLRSRPIEVDYTFKIELRLP